METKQSKSHLRAVVQQVTNNTTSWIGHWKGETKNRVSGQTFLCPSEGELDCIEVFSSHVTNSGPVELAIHAFDAEKKSWGPVLAASQVEFNNMDTGKWISFPLNGLRLQKGMTYGFRLRSDTGLVGIGEAAGSVNHLPYKEGMGWASPSEELPGSFYTYLSLAFKVELRA
ncbi:MAG: hypothetical protein U0T79_05835 [Ferruginibacter sp.]